MSSPSQSFSVISKPLRLKDTLGLPSSLKVLDRPTQYHTARPVNWSWDRKVDSDTYGSLLSSLQKLTTNVVRDDEIKEITRKEKFLNHARYNGALSSGALLPMYKRSLTPSYDGVGSFDQFPYGPGEGYALFGHTNGQYVSTVSSSGTDGDLSYIPGFLGGEQIQASVDFDVLEHFSTIINSIKVGHAGVFQDTFRGGWRRRWVIEFDDCHINDQGSTVILVVYVFTLESQFGFSATWRVRLSFRVDSVIPDSPSDVFINGAYRPVDDRILVLHDFTHVEPVTGYSPDPSSYTVEAIVDTSWFGLSFLRSSGYWALSQSPSDDTRFAFSLFKSTIPTKGGYVSLNRSTLLRRRMDADMQNLRPSSFLAASDALSKATTIFDSNWLQNVQHLKDVLGLLPDVGVMAKILAKINDGDLSLVRDLVDYLTQAILKWNFQQKPLIRDGKAVFAKDLIKSINTLSLPRFLTVYGKYNYTFLDSECYILGTQELETRAKLRLSVDLSSLLTSMLVADSLGFLPTLSRLWSLVPFSFVVDWFTNMSERLNLVDNQIKFLGFNTHYCVYSYRVSHFPNVSDLSRCLLVDNYSHRSRSGSLFESLPLDEQPFHHSVYTRELTFCMPRLQDSRYDFLRRTNAPNNWTVGALLWQLI